MQRYAVFMVGKEMEAILYERSFSASYMDMRVAAAKGVPYGKRDVTGWADISAESIQKVLANENVAALLTMPADAEDTQATMNERPMLARQHNFVASNRVLVPA